MMGRESKWGGKRDGAGRKAGEGSTRVSVPNGCLDAVLALIEAHKAGQPVVAVPVLDAGLDQVEMPLTAFPDLPSDVVELNRANLERLAGQVGDIVGLVTMLAGQKSGEFMKAWEGVPQSDKLKAVRKSRNPSGVYRDGGRVLAHPYSSNMLFWFPPV